VKLSCDWMQASTAANGGPLETASRLLSWIDKVGYYIGASQEQVVVRVLDPAEVDAFARAVRELLDITC